MDKLKVDIHNRILFHHEKERNLAICETWMSLEVSESTELSQVEKEKSV